MRAGGAERTYTTSPRGPETQAVRRPASKASGGRLAREKTRFDMYPSSKEFRAKVNCTSRATDPFMNTAAGTPLSPYGSRPFPLHPHSGLVRGACHRVERAG